MSAEEFSAEPITYLGYSVQRMEGLFNNFLHYGENQILEEL